MNNIYLYSMAVTIGDLTGVYHHLYENLAKYLAENETVRIVGVEQAIELLMPAATPELQTQARQDFVDFIQSFADQTGLDVVKSN